MSLKTPFGAFQKILPNAASAKKPLRFLLPLSNCLSKSGLQTGA
jgi:hypothetical protein